MGARDGVELRGCGAVGRGALVTAYVVRRPTGVGVLSRGKDYSVKDLGTSQEGYTNLLKKELGVSLLADAPQTRWTQIHELSHVRHSLWSPERIARYITKSTGRKVSVMCVLAAEDARINEIAHRRVPDAHKGFALADPTGDGLRRNIEGYAACHASPPELAQAVRPACDPAHTAAVDAWLARLPRVAERELSVLRVTVPLALLLDELQRAPKPDEGYAGDGTSKPEPKPESDDDGEAGESGGGDGGESAPGDEEQPGEGKGAEDAAGDTEGEGEPGSEGGGADTDTDDAAADADDAAALGAPDATGEHACRQPRESTKAEAKWIIPEVLEPTLTVPLRGGNAMVTTAETGTSLRWASLHRIATDGVVFRKVRRRPGALQRGTVLIDVSGSMNFTDADLDAIVAAMPYATVAVYSGWRKAKLVVVARNGKRVASMAEMMLGGNTCDGPALLWLSRQAAPRLWVCDGLVTDSTDAYDRGLAAQCAAIMEAGGVLQVVAQSRGGRAACSRRMVLGVAPQVPELLAAVRELERGRVRP